MKVTLYKNIKSENWYSMERYASALARKFKVQSAKSKVKEFGFNVPRLLFGGRRKFFWRFGVYPFLAQFAQGDVNHITDHSYARAIKYLDPQKTVITCHDLIPLTYEKDSQALAIFKKTISYLPRAQRIIAVSKATKRDLVEKLGVDPEKIVVVYEGVEKKFKITNDELRIFEKEPFHDKKVILHVGNSLEYKNMEGLLKAFAKVVRSEGDVTLVKVGNFTKGQLDLILSLNLKLDLNIFERPGLSEEELVAMYNLATVTCIPSHQEGFGFPVLESLACGAPVVCSNTSSLPEVGGQSALYCNPAKPDSIARKILEVLQMPKPAYQKLSQQGIKHTKKFTWEKCAQETTVVYKQLLNMV